MFTLPLVLLASLIDLILDRFLPNGNGLSWLVAFLYLVVVTISVFVIGVTFGTFLFNL